MGAHGYLVKPFWPGQLLITTMNALRQRELELAQKAHSKALEERLQTLMDRAPVPDLHQGHGAPLRARQPGCPRGRRAGGRTSWSASRDADIMPAEAERRVAESDRRILEHGGTYEAEETLRVGEQERTFLTVKFPFVDDDGRDRRDLRASRPTSPTRSRRKSCGKSWPQAQERAIEELRASRQETVERLAKAIEMHDAETGEHVNRMATIAAFLASQLGLDRDRVLLLRAAAPMHDVGKVATPDGILRKRGPAHPRGARGDGAPHHRRLRDPRRLRERAAAARRDDRADPPRALGRQRLSAGAGR